MFPKGFDLSIDQCESLYSLFENNTQSVNLGPDDGNFLALCFDLCCASPKVKFVTLKFLISNGFDYCFIKTAILTDRQDVVNYIFDKTSFDSQYMTRQYDKDPVIFEEEIKRLLRTSFRVTDCSFIEKAIDLCIDHRRFNIITDTIFEDANINKSIPYHSLKKAIYSVFDEPAICGLNLLAKILEMKIPGVYERQDLANLIDMMRGHEILDYCLFELKKSPKLNRIDDLSFLEIVCLCCKAKLREYIKVLDGSFTEDDLRECIEASFSGKGKDIFEILLESEFVSSIMLDVAGDKEFTLIVCNKIKSLCSM